MTPEQIQSIARTPNVNDVLPLIREIQQLQTERDKLVDFARIQTEKLHIAMKALEVILPGNAAYCGCDDVARQALTEIKSLKE